VEMLLYCVLLISANICCRGINEPGLMIGEFDNARVDRRFDGYTDKEATDKKVSDIGREKCCLYSG
jgi:hypothetical protein